jgi:hypothetical protein
MRIIALYHFESDTARLVEDFAADFERSRGGSIELVSLESKEGADMARLYDIVRYPALLAVRDDGQLSAQWQGDPLPLMDEVAGYLVR